MQEQDILELLQNAAEEWQVTLQVTVRDRHLSVRVSDTDSIDSELAQLLAEETQTFIPNIDRLTVWIQEADGDGAVQHSSFDLSQPLNSDPISLTQFRFVSNSALLAIELPPPCEPVVASVLYVHKLPERDRLELLQSLGTFFERPDKFLTQSVPPQHGEWLETVRSLKLEWFRGVAVWLSRYCHNPNRALPELERALVAAEDPIPDSGVIHSSSPIRLPESEPIEKEPPCRFQEPAIEDRASVGNPAAIARLIDIQLKPWRPLTRASIHQDQLRLQVSAATTPGERGTTALVFVALQQLKLPNYLTQIKLYGLATDRSVQWKSEFDLEGDRTPTSNYNRFSFDNPIVNLVAVPLAMLLAAISNTVVPILTYPMQVWIHELGHATVAWLAGYRALPLPFGWTSVSADSSGFVYFGILFLLGLMFHAGWREKKRAPMVLAGIIALLQVYLTWMLSDRAFDMLMAFGGIGGEFYLSTFLIGCFYLKMPDRFRWDFWRFGVLFVAASTFCHAFWQWHLIDRGLQDIPWGSIFGAGDAGGDMNRLNFDHGWTGARIVSTYSRLGEVCLMAIVGIYGFFAIKLNPRAWFSLRQRAIAWWVLNNGDRSRPSTGAR